jgi:hypothetical protein
VPSTCAKKNVAPCDIFGKEDDMRRRHPFEFSYLSLKQWKSFPLRRCVFDLNHSWLSPLILQVKNELKQKGLRPFFHTWVSDEWFSPDGCPGIALPYYLFHPKLIELHKLSGLMTEGTTKNHALKLIRHEVGHAIENAWRLRRRKKRQQLFGKSSTPYPNFYRPNKRSRDFVVHLEDHYAQSHPDEDWAETFALWLSTSKKTWSSRYQGTKALEKLQYCDELMLELAGTRPLNNDRFVVSPIEDVTGTVGQFMKKRAHHRARALSRLVTVPQKEFQFEATNFLNLAPILIKQQAQGILM